MTRSSTRRLMTALATVPATLALAATSDAAVLEAYAPNLEYTGTANAETIDVTPNGTGFVVESNYTITVADSADADCSPSAKVVSCVVAKPLRVWAVGGADTITIHDPVGGTAATGFTVDGGDQSDIVTGSSIADTISGGAGDDTLLGEGGNDSVSGDQGEDQVEGGAGDDTLSGGSEHDNVIGGTDNDTIAGGTGDDGIAGGAGDDHITPGLGDDGDVLGGAGTDTIAYLDAQGPVSVDLATTAGRDGSDADGDEDARDIENVTGTASTDTLLGTEGPNTIKTRGGADTATGRGGADTLEGESGGETLLGGEGDDVLKGQAGPDTLLGGGGHDSLWGGTEADLLSGGSGSDLVDGDQGADTVDYSDRSSAVTVDLSAASAPINGGTIDDVDGAGPSTTRDLLTDVEHVKTGSGDDTLTGDILPNTLAGGSGADQIAGGGGIDNLDGGQGADVLKARDGFAETVLCGDGVDVAEIDEIDLVGGCETIQLAGAAIENGGPIVTGETGATGETGGSTGGTNGGGGTGQAGGPGETRPQTTPPLPRLGTTLAPKFRTRGGKTIVTAFRVNGAVAGTAVTITCAAPKKRACPFKLRTVQVSKTAKRLDLTKLVGAKTFARGAVLDVRITGAGWTGVGVRYAFRGGAKKPTRSTLAV